MSQNADVSPATTGRKPVPQHADAITRLRQVVHDLRSPGGCPWDIEQTHESLLTNLLEEAYESVEAIRSGDWPHMCEELGDLLLQVVMHSEMASETGAFDFDAVAAGIAEKLVRRHPHVYATSGVDDTAGVLNQWEVIKAQEKGDKAPKGWLEGVGRGLPGLARAAKVQKKAGKVGFDWPDTVGVREKIREELAEVEAAPDAESRAEEIGDLLFSVVNLARKEGHDPEILMTAATEKFVARFGKMERALKEDGLTLEAATVEQMEERWQAAKGR